MTSNAFVRIRPGTSPDLYRIVEIHNHYVLNGVATFDVVPSTVESRTTWFAQFQVKGPHQLLVADRDGSVVGYACSSPYRPHPAFLETVEFSIYVDPEDAHLGVGSALYSVLIANLENEQVHRALAGIAQPNEASVALHRRFGFEEVGVYDEYAIVSGRYVSSMWMQRSF
jgi:phosphinothricin acetyltransferase